MVDTLINFNKGITHSPSDFLSVDGELEECVNLEVIDGELRTVELPVEINLSLSSEQRLMCVHTTESGVHNYIVVKHTASPAYDIYYLQAYKKIDSSFVLSTSSNKLNGMPDKVIPLGNILICYYADSMQYFLYKDGSYSYLGEKFPEMDIAFSLSGPFTTSYHTFDDIDVEDKYVGQIRYPVIDDTFESEVLGQANKFISEECTEKGYFMYPFFIRWAYRLFDGTHTMQSAPILMIPSTHLSPIAGLTSDNGEGDDFKMYVAAYLAEIQMNIDSSQLSELKNWSDIITGIDIFVSQQIYSYDQAQTEGDKVSAVTIVNGSLPLAETSLTYFLGSYTNSTSSVNGKHKLLDVAENFVTNYSPRVLQLPTLSTDTIYKQIRECSNFYKYASIDMDKLASGMTNIHQYGLETTSNEVIVTQETLDDDYQSHDIILPESAIVYNKRINMGSIRRKLFSGFSPRAMLQLLEQADTTTNKTATWQAQVWMDGKRFDSEETQACPYCVYAYFPNVSGLTMYLVNKDTSSYIRCPLTEHSGLNGSYYFSGFDGAIAKTATGTMLSLISGDGSGDVWETQANALYLSEVSNPFQFDLNGIYTVGNGTLIGLSTLVRPVSQGQFGEYPLIAFCTDGNYGLRVSDEGYYTNISPMQEDVALSQEQITNMESSILLITKKGIMETGGSEINQLCPKMDGRKNTLLSDVKKGAWESMIAYTEDTDGFMKFLISARMAYDYASNRVLLYREDKTYSYLIQMDTQAVTKLVLGNGEKILTHVVDYPDVIVQTDKSCYSLYQKEDVNELEDRRKGFALTRPLKLDSPLQLKVVERVKMLLAKNSAESSVQYALYGSQDNITYNKVSSRFGKAYKYYKLAIYTDMIPGESLSGTEVRTSLRRTHKLR